MNKNSECKWTFQLVVSDYYAKNSDGSFRSKIPDFKVVRMCVNCGRLETKLIIHESVSNSVSEFEEHIEEWKFNESDPYCDPILTKEQLEELKNHRKEKINATML